MLDRKREAGRKAAVEHSKLESEILHHRNEIIISGKIAFPKSKVWYDISARFENKVSPKGIYTYVQKNRNGIWSHLGLQTVTQELAEDLCENNQQLNEEENQIIEHSTDSNSSEKAENEATAVDILKFCIQISAEEWTQMAPYVESYARKEKRRNYSVLRKRTWTHIFNSKIWKESRLCCAFSFKRCKVTPRGQNYLTIFAKCMECNSLLKGVVQKEPPKNTNIVSVLCTISGNFLKKHTLKKKRHLSGSIRKEAVKKMCDENISATLLRTTQSSACMNIGDKEPSHIPNLSVLRTAKSKELAKGRYHMDPILAISIAKYQSPYQGVIHDICYDRFYVHYWSSAQLHVYRAFCKQYTHPKVCIDATAGLVRKIKRYTGQMSNQIFLYQILATDQDCNKQFPVSQLLSERQDTVSIQHWLNQWIQSGAIPPKEVVSDMSKAIIGATVRAFTQFCSLEDYIIRCGYIVTNKNQNLQYELPLCFVRLDVAHIMKLVSQWECLRLSRKRVKEFYLHGIAQLVLSKDLETCKTLLKTIFIVAFSENDGFDAITNDMTECEKAKQSLKKLYSSSQAARVNNFVEEVLQESSIVEIGFEEDSEAGLQFQNMALNIAEAIEQQVPPQNDGHDNLQYLPEISQPLARLFRMLPLWSNVMVPFFKYGSIPASNAAVESHFNILKNMIFSNHTLPIRLDDYLLIHVKALDGIMKLAEADDDQQQTTDTIPNQDQDTDMPNIQEDMNLPQTQDDCNETNLSRCKEINLENLEEACPSCSMGNYPDQNGGHKCAVCYVPVHALEECSLPAPGSEEGYGQKRICKLCANISDTEKRRIQERNEIENWRGLAEKSKKRTYFQPHPKWKDIDLSKVTERTPLGVLKNGHRPELKAVKLGTEILSLSNTCAADSLVQIMATATAYSESFKTFVVAEKNNSLLMELIHFMLTKGILNKTYALRAKMLRSISEPEKLPAGILRLNCEENIGSLASKLMQTSPSLIENSTCNSNHCPKKETVTSIPVPILQIKRTSMNGVQCMEQLIQQIIRIDEQSECKSIFKNVRNVPCESYFRDTSISKHALCTGIRTANTKLSAKLLVVQLMYSPYENIPSLSDIDEHNDIPTEVLQKNSLDEFPLNITVENNKFYLRGVVGFNHSGMISAIGHYIAYALRNDGKWEVYDDLTDKVKLSPKTHKVAPHLVFYSI